MIYNHLKHSFRQSVFLHFNVISAAGPGLPESILLSFLTEIHAWPHLFSGRKIVRKDRCLAGAIFFDRRRYMTISELFRKIREDKTLCEALGRLMADEIDKEIDEAVRMARTDGYSNGFLTPYVLL